MPIAFRCPCSQDLEVDDHFAGQEVACPTCRTVVAVPAGRRVATPTVVAPPPPPPSLPPSQPGRGRVPVVPPSGDPDDDNYGVARDRPSRKPRRPDLEEEQNRVRGRKKPRKPAEESRSLEGGILNGGVAGGMIAIVIAVIWFFAGMAAGRIFIYPPILFVIGLIGVVKGLVSGGDD